MAVYKHLVPDRMDVLTGGHIRFTPPTALDDACDLKPHFDALVADEVLRQQLPENPDDLRPYIAELHDGLPVEQRQDGSLDDVMRMLESVLQSDEGRAIFQQTIEMGMGPTGMRRLG